MAHRFSTIPENHRVLIDTNVLLNAVFIEDGIARRAIEAVRALGHTVYCDEISHFEATRRLAQARNRLRLAYDPNAAFAALSPQIGIIFLAPGDPAIPTGIHRHDRHIARAAMGYATWVMTDDLDLQIALTEAGFEARNSFEVLQAAFEAGAAIARNPPLPGRVPRPQPGPAKGWFLAWVTPGGWAGGLPSGNHTVVDIPAFARLLYDTEASVWRAEMHQSGPILSVAATVQPDKPEAIGFGFDNSRVPTRFFIGAGSPGGERRYERIRSLVNGVPPFTLGGAALGHSLSNVDHWNGYIRRISSGNRFISKSLWTRLTSVQDLAPHPQLDVLDAALVVVGNLISSLGTVAARAREL